MVGPECLALASPKSTFSFPLRALFSTHIAQHQADLRARRPGDDQYIVMKARQLVACARIATPHQNCVVVQFFMASKQDTDGIIIAVGERNWFLAGPCLLHPIHCHSNGCVGLKKDIHLFLQTRRQCAAIPRFYPILEGGDRRCGTIVEGMENSFRLRPSLSQRACLSSEFVVRLRKS
ncbi:hypothetical protein P171DRAFT_434873 [Karstenula rhodostoma CBS 690.94]|uniref:Uncharacterized protein n=1 Tax=Karstenula rhodostoma CBS 690.94 TaxID=1392251 RepID=A0A9P4PD58_9PLEO|nr:hypothetical protein P171DRAFT_434873 [Karstenula rhodostoma CBS 690.94]